MTDEDMQHFIELTAAATFATKAILACRLANIPVSREECAKIYGPWLNKYTGDNFIAMVDAHIIDMLKPAKDAFKATKTQGNA